MGEVKEVKEKPSNSLRRRCTVQVFDLTTLQYYIIGCKINNLILFPSATPTDHQRSSSLLALTDIRGRMRAVVSGNDKRTL